jgi:hypothetical protein
VLEARQVEAREREREECFKLFDLDGSGAVDAAELQHGMRTFAGGAEIDEALAKELVKAHDRNGDGVLQPEEFELSALQTTLEGLLAARREEELESFRKTREQQDEEKALEAEQAALPEANEDTGLLTRMVSCLPYLMPMIHCLKYGVLYWLMLASEVPFAAVVFQTLLNVFQWMLAFPFADLILIFGMQALADNAKLPMLLRFNLRQAILIDVGLGLFGLADGLVESMLHFSLPVSPIFFLTMAFTTYALLYSLLGIAPDGIPLVSKDAYNSIAPTKPRSEQEPERDGPSV